MIEYKGYRNTNTLFPHFLPIYITAKNGDVKPVYVGFENFNFDEDKLILSLDLVKHAKHGVDKNGKRKPLDKLASFSLDLELGKWSVYNHSLLDNNDNDLSKLFFQNYCQVLQTDTDYWSKMLKRYALGGLMSIILTTMLSKGTSLDGDDTELNNASQEFDVEFTNPEITFLKVVYGLIEHNNPDKMTKIWHTVLRQIIADYIPETAQETAQENSQNTKGSKKS